MNISHEKWSIEYKHSSKAFEKCLKNLNERQIERIKNNITALENNPYIGKKLKGLKNEYSIRFGKFRLLYEVDKKKVTIDTFEKRGKAYKELKKQK